MQLIIDEAVKENFHLKNDAVRRAIASEFLRSQVNETVAVSEEEVRAIYEKYRDNIDRIRVDQLIVQVPQATKNGSSSPKTDQNREKALQLAQESLAQLNQGVSFDEVANQLATKAEGKSREDTGWFSRTHPFVESFKEAAFKLKNVGDISAVVETRYGFHILKLTGDLRGFDKNKPVIRGKLELGQTKRSLRKKIRNSKGERQSHGQL